MECTVPVEVELATDHADVGSLERTISAALVEVGAQLWRELIARIEAALPVPVGCPACGGPMKANGRASRRLVTLAGEVELRRRRYRCTACGAELVPLDAALGLEPRVQHTLGVQERGLWLVTEMRYQRAVYPDARVVFMFGYAGEALSAQGALDPSVAFLAKPFVPKELARKVRETLDGGPLDPQPEEASSNPGH